MTKSQYFWYMVVQVALIYVKFGLVLCTILLAVIAIWGKAIRAKYYGPLLNIELSDSKGNQSIFGDGIMSRYYHIVVRNKRRLSPAHNVRVVIRGILRLSSDGTMEPTIFPGPMQLAWQFQAFKPQFQTIGAKSFCDLGYIRKGEDFTLSILYGSISFDKTLSAGKQMTVTIVALSDEVESEELRLEVAWDGKWDDDSNIMCKHLVIKSVTNEC